MREAWSASQSIAPVTGGNGSVDNLCRTPLRLTLWEQFLLHGMRANAQVFAACRSGDSNLEQREAQRLRSADQARSGVSLKERTTGDSQVTIVCKPISRSVSERDGVDRCRGATRRIASSSCRRPFPPLHPSVPLSIMSGIDAAKLKALQDRAAALKLGESPRAGVVAL